jgi:hypothetical protein
MSELIEQLARQDKYWQSNGRNEFNWLLFGEDLIKAYQAAAYTKVSQSSEPISAAVLPNGQTCTNVYEAYEIGLTQAAAPIDNVAEALEKAADIANSQPDKGEQWNDACIKIRNEILALIPDTQAKKGE